MSELEEKVQELLQFAKKHGLVEMMWKDGDTKISFRRDANDIPAPAVSSNGTVSEAAAAPEEDQATLVRAPMVGTFRRSVTKGRPPLVMIGNHIKPGDSMGVVECMKIPTDVVSFCAGEVKEVLVEDGQTVEYGQPLFTVIPAMNGSTNGNGHV